VFRSVVVTVVVVAVVVVYHLFSDKLTGFEMFQKQ